MCVCSNVCVLPASTMCVHHCFGWRRYSSPTADESLFQARGHKRFKASWGAGSASGDHIICPAMWGKCDAIFYSTMWFTADRWIRQDLDKTENHGLCYLQPLIWYFCGAGCRFEASAVVIPALTVTGDVVMYVYLVVSNWFPRFSFIHLQKPTNKYIQSRWIEANYCTTWCYSACAHWATEVRLHREKALVSLCS